MESEFDDYPQRVIAAVQTADVLTIFFPRVGRSLILDLRRETTTAPAVLLDGMVESPRERLASFRRLRPGLPLPERMTVAPWPEAVRAFAETGVLDAVVDRCRREGGENLGEVARRLFDYPRSLERETLRDLVRGVGMQTIWQRGARG